MMWTLGEADKEIATQAKDVRGGAGSEKCWTLEFMQLKKNRIVQVSIA